MSNSAVLNGGATFVLDDLDAGLVADGFLVFLIVPVRRISGAPRVELEGVPAGGGFRAAEHHADLHADLVDEMTIQVGLLDGGGELAQRPLISRACRQVGGLSPILAFDLGL